ncbi:MAG: magnesium/cobalt transporter CorA [Candidatus Binatia bacterium]
MKKHHALASLRHGKRKNRPFRRHTPPGSPPGTLVADPTSSRPHVTLLLYSPQELREQQVSDLRELAKSVGKWPVTWVNVEGLGDVNTISQIGELFGLHRLALEDVLHTHQRPKVEQYGNHHFIVTRMAMLTDHLETEQLSIFLGKNFVLTFQEGLPGDSLEPVRERIRHQRGHVREGGNDHLVYALLDAVVDNYFPVLEAYGERLEALEDEIVTHPSPTIVTRIHAIRRDLLTIRRAVWPQREAFAMLMREETPLITAETRVYLRDCYDHVTQIIDLVETYRELGADLTEIYLSSVSNRTNEIMRVLTVIATIFIPLTFIAGIYGMNFDTKVSPLNMPELDWYWGYPLALFLMLAVAGGQLIFFRRRGWLGTPKTMNDDDKSRV